MAGKHRNMTPEDLANESKASEVYQPGMAPLGRGGNPDMATKKKGAPKKNPPKKKVETKKPPKVDEVTKGPRTDLISSEVTLAGAGKPGTPPTVDDAVDGGDPDVNETEIKDEPGKDPVITEGLKLVRANRFGAGYLPKGLVVERDQVVTVSEVGPEAFKKLAGTRLFDPCTDE